MTQDPLTLAAIDVGTNAVRLKLARPQAGGGLEPLHEERDPVRPGEGVFRTGSMPEHVAERLVATLRRYAAICRRYRAQVRAVATSAVREARNGSQIQRRVRREAGIDLEVISGREEARLICLGVLHGTPREARSLVVDIGGGSTEVAIAEGERPRDLFTTALGSVRLTELFDASTSIKSRKLRLMREYAAEVAERGLPGKIAGAPRRAIGSSGTIRAVVGFAAAPGTAHASVAQIARAVDELAEMGIAGRRKRFEPGRAEIIVAGAVVLEAIARRLGLASIAATDLGLRDGLLLDLDRRLHRRRDLQLTESAIEVGRWFRFDEPHARHVQRMALALFDALAPLHKLPAAARAYLEVAAILHDIGHVVGHQRHHKHTAYLIEQTDIPGLADHEKALIALIARYHRRSDPELAHAGLEGVTTTEARLVRKLATILRVADSLDRSHHQPVRKIRSRITASTCFLYLSQRAPLDLELWDAQHEAALFRRVFGRRLELKPAA